MTGAMSYDSVAVSGLGVGNAEGMRSVSLTAVGGQLGIVAGSLRARVGRSACASTVWMSDTGVVCRVGAGGVGSSGSVVITAVVGVGTVSEGVSFDAGEASGVVGHNRGARLVAASMTLTAQSFGSTSGSVRTSAGRTGCEASTWASMSSLVCRMPRWSSGGGSKAVVVTAGSKTKGSLTTAMSLELALVSAVLESRTNGHGGGHGGVTVWGLGLGEGRGSVAGGVGRSACEATEWGSDSVVTCKVASGSGGSLSVRVTSGVLAGSTSRVMSYDRGEVGGQAEGWMTGGAVQNVAGGGGGAVVVVQAGGQAMVASGAGRVGWTACAASEWMTATEVRCMVARGARGSSGVVVTAGSTVRTASGFITYDVGVVTGSRGSNGGATGASWMTVGGAHYGWVTWSVGSRQGQSGCESTVWVADSSVMCRSASGAGGSRTVLVSMGAVGGSVSEAASYGGAGASTVSGANGPGGAGGRQGGGGKVVEVRGSGLGQVGRTAWARVGASSCEASIWRSESAVVCHVAVGTEGSGRVVLTAGAGGTGSVSEGWSYDSVAISGEAGGRRNGPAGGTAGEDGTGMVWVGGGTNHSAGLVYHNIP